MKYAARGKYVPKLLCFALVKSWCGSRDKRIKRGRAAERWMEFAEREGAGEGGGKHDKRNSDFWIPGIRYG